jgi:hypothetical protein
MEQPVHTPLQDDRQPLPRALMALARLLARQAAREFLASSPLANGEPADDEV